jgi:hypothetical protein
MLWMQALWDIFNPQEKKNEQLAAGSSRRKVCREKGDPEL